METRITVRRDGPSHFRVMASLVGGKRPFGVAEVVVDQSGVPLAIRHWPQTNRNVEKKAFGHISNCSALGDNPCAFLARTLVDKVEGPGKAAVIARQELKVMYPSLVGPRRRRGSPVRV